MSAKALIVTLVLALLAGAVFAVRPGIDIAASAWFFDGGPFAGAGAGERLLRRVFYYAPLAVPVAMTVFWLLPKLGFVVSPRLVPAGRTMVFLLGGLILGPLLLVNVVLKEHSDRPRPNQIVQFGGSSEFRPWNRFDGPCKTNCSFVSGEVSTSAWLVAPASLLPAPWKAPAVAAALIFTAATGILRMAFGAHFLSDVVFAILFTLLVCQLLHLLLMRRRSRPGRRP